MSRIIINNNVGVEDRLALDMVLSVVSDGLISKHAGRRCYCLCTVFDVVKPGKNPQKVAVIARRHRSGTHAFSLEPA